MAAGLVGPDTPQATTAQRKGCYGNTLVRRLSCRSSCRAPGGAGPPPPGVHNYEGEKVSETEEEQHARAHREIEEQSETNRRRVLTLAVDLNAIAVRVHALEDQFELGGVIQGLLTNLHALTAELERLRDGQQRPRHSNPEHSTDGTDEPASESGASTAGEGE